MVPDGVATAVVPETSNGIPVAAVRAVLAPFQMNGAATLRALAHPGSLLALFALLLDFARERRGLTAARDARVDRAIRVRNLRGIHRLRE